MKEIDIGFARISYFKLNILCALPIRPDTGIGTPAP